MSRKRCTHRYKGLYGNYEPRHRRTRDGYWVVEYKCQIIGCNHWQEHFRNKLPKPKAAEASE